MLEFIGSKKLRRPKKLVKFGGPMAAKNLREAILNGLTENKVYLSEDQTRRLEGELRDYIVHEMARAIGAPPREGTIGEQIAWKEHETYLALFFHRIFKDVSAYQKEDK